MKDKSSQIIMLTNGCSCILIQLFTNTGHRKDLVLRHQVVDSWSTLVSGYQSLNTKHIFYLLIIPNTGLNFTSGQKTSELILLTLEKLFWNNVKILVTYTIFKSLFLFSHQHTSYMPHYIKLLIEMFWTTGKNCLRNWKKK